MDAKTKTLDITSIDLASLTTDELTKLKAQIAAEIASREATKALVLYTHECKDSSRYHLGKYKHWAKRVASVDVAKTNGYAWGGEFLNVTSEHKLPAGSIVVEVCGDSISAYKITTDGKELLGTARTNAQSQLIELVAKELER